MTKAPKPPHSFHVTSERAIGRRRLFEAMLTAVPLVVGIASCSSAEAEADVFQHGVASGDPLPDGVILWTRVTTDALSVDVAWEVSEDPAFGVLAGTGSFRTDAERDYTVKVDARALAPGRTYFFRFRALGVTSRVGRTRTAPVGAAEHLRIGMVSCSSYAHGYFHVYRALAEQADLDFVLHLGDYIYEYGNTDYGDLREMDPPHETLTLADYRKRHAHYKREAELQEVHRQHPFVTIWDDHETANDSFRDGAQNHDDAEGPWAERRDAGKRAYFEWMPIREGEDGRLYRKLAFGDLVDLVLLDTRLEGRTPSPAKFFGEPPAPDPTRTLLGDAQATWLEDQLRTSTARWKLLGQQVMISTLVLDDTQIFNLDQWHGYPESRARLFQFIRSAAVKNLVVLTGDIHSSWALELTEDPTDPALYDPATGRGSVGVELVTPGVTSPGIPEALVGIFDAARPLNPQAKWVEPTKRGYVVLDVTRERVEAAWFHVDDVTKAAGATITFANAFQVADGRTQLVAAATPSPARPGAPPLAP